MVARLYGSDLLWSNRLFVESGEPAVKGGMRFKKVLIKSMIISVAFSFLGKGDTAFAVVIGELAVIKAALLAAQAAGVADKVPVNQGGNPHRHASSQVSSEKSAATQGTASKGQPATSAPSSAQARPLPYRLLGILDPDREHIVAFALKVPSEGRVKQEFYRKWEGAVGLPQITITLSAPDGRSQIVYFPSTMYLYSEGPMTSNLRAQKRSFGMPPESLRTRSW